MTRGECGITGPQLRFSPNLSDYVLEGVLPLGKLNCFDFLNRSDLRGLNRCCRLSPRRNRAVGDSSGNQPRPKGCRGIPTRMCAIAELSRAYLVLVDRKIGRWHNPWPVTGTQQREHGLACCESGSRISEAESHYNARRAGERKTRMRIIRQGWNPRFPKRRFFRELTPPPLNAFKHLTDNRPSVFTKDLQGQHYVHRWT